LGAEGIQAVQEGEGYKHQKPDLLTPEVRQPILRFFNVATTIWEHQYPRQDSAPQSKEAEEDSLQNMQRLMVQSF